MMELPDHLPLSPISSARPRRHDSICSGRRHCRSFSDWGRRPPCLSPELAPSPSPTIGDSRLKSREGATCPALGPLPLPYLAIQLGDATLRPLPPPPFWTPVTTTPAQRPQATLRKVNFLAIASNLLFWIFDGTLYLYWLFAHEKSKNASWSSSLIFLLFHKILFNFA